jgi:hypothetical protein
MPSIRNRNTTFGVATDYAPHDQEIGVLLRARQEMFVFMASILAPGPTRPGSTATLLHLAARLPQLPDTRPRREASLVEGRFHCLRSL